MRRTNHDTTPRTRNAPPKDEDLEFLFCEADGEIGGLRSVHGALVDRAQTGAALAGAGTRGIPRSVEGISARQANAVERERPLRQRLAQLTREHQDILRRAYGHQPLLAVDEQQRLGRWAEVAVTTDAARCGWDAERRRRLALAKGEASRLLEVERWRAKGLTHWLRGPGIDADDLGAVREEAQTLVNAAWAAWHGTRAPNQGRTPDWTKRRRASRQDSDDGDRQSGEVVIDAFVPAWHAGEREAG